MMDETESEGQSWSEPPASDPPPAAPAPVFSAPSADIPAYEPPVQAPADPVIWPDPALAPDPARVPDPASNMSPIPVDTTIYSPHGSADVPLPKAKRMDDWLTPDLSAKPFGLIAMGCMVAALGVLGPASFAAWTGLMSVGLTLGAYQMFPELDKGTKGWGLLAVTTAVASFLFPPVSFALGIAAIASGAMAWKSEHDAVREYNLAEILRAERLAHQERDINNTPRNHWLTKNPNAPAPSLIEMAQETHTSREPYTSPRNWRATLRSEPPITGRGL